MISSPRRIIAFLAVLHLFSFFAFALPRNSQTLHRRHNRRVGRIERDHGAHDAPFSSLSIRDEEKKIIIPELKPDFEITEGISLVRKVPDDEQGTTSEVWIAKMGTRDVVVKIAISKKHQVILEAEVRNLQDIHETLIEKAKDPKYKVNVNNALKRIVEVIPSPESNWITTRDGYKFIVMKYYSGGDLFGAIVAERKYRGDEKALRRVFRQIAEGLWGVHHAGFAHRDFKLENILWEKNPDDPNLINIVIADFGFSRKGAWITNEKDRPGTTGLEPPGKSTCLCHKILDHYPDM